MEKEIKLNEGFFRPRKMNTEKIRCPETPNRLALGLVAKRSEASSKHFESGSEDLGSNPWH